VALVVGRLGAGLGDRQELVAHVDEGHPRHPSADGEREQPAVEVGGAAPDLRSAASAAAPGTYHDTKLALIIFVTGKRMTRAVEASLKKPAESSLVVGEVERRGDTESRTWSGPCGHRHLPS
jgi:hypothetical protein